MALILNEAYRVKFFYRQGSNDAMMIANWMLVDFIAGATETELAFAFLTDFEIVTNAPVRSTSSVCYRIEVAETFGGLDFGVADGDVVGLKAGEPAPSFNAMAIRQNVGTHLVRPGQKRIPFIGESSMNGNNPVLSVAEQTNLEVGYGQEITINWVDAQLIDWIFIIRPMVIGTVNTGTPENPDYVLDPAKQVLVRSAEVTRITSQVSRKA